MNHRIALCACALVATVACSSSSESDPEKGAPNPQLLCDDTVPVTFTELHAQVIAPACTGCHHGASGGTAPDMSTAEIGFASTRNAPSIGYAQPLRIVDPGAPHNSTMMLKVLGGDAKGFTGPNGESVGGIMPQIGTLSTSQKDAIRHWVCTGAQP